MRWCLLLAVCLLGGCSSVPGRAVELDLIEFLPGVRIDRTARVVEFDGVVAVDAYHPETPDVYLELIVCSPDTREHESLVVTEASPSLIHAALLAVGVEPGAPGGFVESADGIERVEPLGDRVRVELITSGGTALSGSWIRTRDGGRIEPLAFVFAGSRESDRGGAIRYDADGTGVVIGLATFGSEVIAPARVISPESAIDEPTLLARRGVIPERGTPVTVRVTGIKDPA